LFICLPSSDNTITKRGVIYIINRKGQRLKTIKVGKGIMFSLYCGKDKIV
jgi:hypothetical protein